LHFSETQLNVEQPCKKTNHSLCRFTLATEIQEKYLIAVLLKPALKYFRKQFFYTFFTSPTRGRLLSLPLVTPILFGKEYVL